MKDKRNKTIALAGIFQAAAAVQQLAWAGKFEHNHVTILIESLFSLNASSIDDIYKDLTKLQLGLETCIRILEANHKFPKDQEIARYALSLIHVERCLAKRKELLNQIKKGIIKAEHQTASFPLTHDNIMANLAGIYTDTISTMNFRIHITGEQNYLTTINNANKIRAILLAGVRAAVLWHQMGGSRWQLFFRRQIVNEAKVLQEEVKNKMQAS